MTEIIAGSAEESSLALEQELGGVENDRSARGPLLDSSFLIAFHGVESGA